jgi:hypothetical protein
VETLDVATATEALLLSASFVTPPEAPAITEVSALFDVFDLTFAAAWRLGNDQIMSQVASNMDLKPLEPKIFLADARGESETEVWLRTQIFQENIHREAEFDREVLRPLRSTIDELSPAMPRVTAIGMNSPIEFVTLVPSAFVTGLGALYTTMKLLELIFTAPFRVSSEIKRHQAERARWEAERTAEERRVLEQAAARISRQGPPAAIALELRSTVEDTAPND